MIGNFLDLSFLTWYFSDELSLQIPRNLAIVVLRRLAHAGFKGGLNTNKIVQLNFAYFVSIWSIIPALILNVRASGELYV